MKKLYSLLPTGIKSNIIGARDAFQRITCYGTGRWCPVCRKSSRRFRGFGIPLRPEAQCVHCDALERHRFVWLYFDRKTDLFDGKCKNVLHIAPEGCFEKRLKERLGSSYITADLLDTRAMAKMDVTNIQYPDGYFDVVYCSHVLEHIPDDKRAMREFHRVLKPDGWGILLVPITVDVTFEDASAVEPHERLRLFGQEDHVRRYGPDFVDRLQAAGFTVATIEVSGLCKGEEQFLMGLTQATGEIYFCTK